MLYKISPQAITKTLQRMYKPPLGDALAGLRLAGGVRGLTLRSEFGHRIEVETNR